MSDVIVEYKGKTQEELLKETDYKCSFIGVLAGCLSTALIFLIFAVFVFISLVSCAR